MTGRPGASAGTWFQRRAPSSPARPRASKLAGQGGGATAFLHLQLLLLLNPATRRCCTSRSAVSGIHPPSFLSFLSFRFLFSNCVPAAPWEGRWPPEQLANSGWDASRCCLHLLVPEKLRSVLGELGALGGGGVGAVAPPSQELSIAWGCWEEQGNQKSELEDAAVPAGGSEQEAPAPPLSPASRASQPHQSAGPSPCC